MSSAPRSGPFAGRRIVTTRDRPGVLDEALAALGATVVHVPLLEIVDEPSVDLSPDSARFDDIDWVVVTSQHGAARVAPALAVRGRLRTAAVGARTAEVLSGGSGRPVDVVPARQTAADLVVAMPEPTPGSDRVLVAQGDLAASDLVDGLRHRGYRVDAVVAYRTRHRDVSVDERRSVAGADAVVFASGSAVEAWVRALGVGAPPHVVVIGPTTAAVADSLGVAVTAVAAEHSVDGLVASLLTELTADS